MEAVSVYWCRMRNRLLLVSVLLVFAGAGALRAAPPDAYVADLRVKFTAYLQGAEQAHTNRLAAWRDDYARALVGASRKLQEAGRAEDSAAIDAEFGRFRREGRAVPAGAGDIAELAALRKSAEAREQALWRERWTAILSGARKYAGLLEERESKSTEANDMERAIACKEERERAMMDPAVTEAEFELAVMDVGMPAGAVTPEEPAETVAAATETSEGAPSLAGDEVPVTASVPAHPSGLDRSPGIKVYGAGQKVPAEDSSAKRLTLVRTEYGPLGNRLVVTASAVAKSESKKEGSQYRTESVLARWYLRLQLRAVAAAGGAVENPVVTVLMYTKSAQSQGRVEPVLASVQRVPLRAIGTDTTTITFPPVETRMRRERPGTGEVWRYMGKEFYGAIISMFDADKSLLYQTVTTRGLLGVASPELPGRTHDENLEDARVAMDAAHEALNEARLLFFANQRIEANREAFVEATGRYEAAKKAYEELMRQGNGDEAAGEWQP